MGIGRASLDSWVRTGRVRPSFSYRTADGKIRCQWTETDIERLVEYMAMFYRGPFPTKPKQALKSCPKCGGLFESAGLKRHIKECVQRPSLERYLTNLHYKDG